jgi:hypothetical protein
VQTTLSMQRATPKVLESAIGVIGREVHCPLRRDSYSRQGTYQLKAHQSSTVEVGCAIAQPRTCPYAGEPQGSYESSLYRAANTTSLTDRCRIETSSQVHNIVGNQFRVLYPIVRTQLPGQAITLPKATCLSYVETTLFLQDNPPARNTITTTSLCCLYFSVAYLVAKPGSRAPRLKPFVEVRRRHSAIVGFFLLPRTC